MSVNETHRDLPNASLDGEMPQGQPANEEIALVTNFKLEVSLWLPRLKIILLIVLYLISWPMYGDLYYKVLLAHSAASFVHLQQRLFKPQLKYGYLEKLLLDNCSHNVLYSLICLFILLSLVDLGIIGRSTKFVESQSIRFLRIIAVTEIFILVLIPFHLQFWSLSQICLTLITIYMYMKFLVMRFNSRHNPFTIIVLGQLRDEIEKLTLKPFCPTTVRHLLSKLTAFLTSRFGRNNELQHFVYSKKPLFGTNSFLSELA